MGDEDRCPKNGGKPHEPDWNTVRVEPDGDQLYVDVNCQICGRSGCIGTEKTLTENISW
jgi:hypothetical protein